MLLDRSLERRAATRPARAGLMEILDPRVFIKRWQRVLPPTTKHFAQKVNYYRREDVPENVWPQPELIATTKLVQFAYQQEYRLGLSTTGALDFGQCSQQLVDRKARPQPQPHEHHTMTLDLGDPRHLQAARTPADVPGKWTDLASTLQRSREDPWANCAVSSSVTSVEREPNRPRSSLRAAVVSSPLDGEPIPRDGLPDTRVQDGGARMDAALHKVACPDRDATVPYSRASHHAFSIPIGHARWIGEHTLPIAVSFITVFLIPILLLVVVPLVPFHAIHESMRPSRRRIGVLTDNLASRVDADHLCAARALNLKNAILSMPVSKKTAFVHCRADRVRSECYG